MIEEGVRCFISGFLGIIFTALMEQTKPNIQEAKLWRPTRLVKPSPSQARPRLPFVDSEFEKARACERAGQIGRAFGWRVLARVRRFGLSEIATWRVERNQKYEPISTVEEKLYQ